MRRGLSEMMDFCKLIAGEREHLSLTLTTPPYITHPYNTSYQNHPLIMILSTLSTLSHKKVSNFILIKYYDTPYQHPTSHFQYILAVTGESFQPDTILQSAGVADVIATCFGGRNRRCAADFGRKVSKIV